MYIFVNSVLFYDIIIKICAALYIIFMFFFSSIKQGWLVELIINKSAILILCIKLNKSTRVNELTNSMLLSENLKRWPFPPRNRTRRRFAMDALTVIMCHCFSHVSTTRNTGKIKLFVLLYIEYTLYTN